MANIARWDPFEDSLLNVFPALLSRPGYTSEAKTVPRMDLAETDENYRIAIDMPGIPKEAIQVSIDRNNVTISAERREEKAVDDKAEWLLRERGYGRVSRSLTLPLAVDESSAEAHYVNGVLYLTLPKISTMKRLAVH